MDRSIIPNYEDTEEWSDNAWFLVSQVVVAGQGLNDDMWHTLRFSRRSNAVKFQVDDEAPVQGELPFAAAAFCKNCVL